ncbi:MAG: sulfatase-like hydrolase/transferase [Verrucomicrobiia bacterium]|jgi:uncharacterized sulfatase
MKAKRLIHLLALAAFALATPNLIAASRTPNIIIMNTDDHAQWAVGCYGNKEIHTPHMDRLAREGMRFNRAFSKPVCSPSRAMQLTGQYTHRTGIPDFIPYGSPVPVLPDNGLTAGTPTIASVLKGVGYTSALIGKWHLGYGEKHYPQIFGFDVAEGFRYIAPGKQYANSAKIPILLDGKKLDASFVRDPRHTDILTDRAIRFVRDSRTKSFFLFFNVYVPHEATQFTTEEDLAHYKDRPLTVPDLSRFPGTTMETTELRRLLSVYYAHLTCADRNLGRLLATLDELGLAENTLIIFMGDNGFNIGHHGMRGKGNGWILDSNKRNTRPNLFDTSVLVPFIVRWPAAIKPGQTSDALVSTIDILPTLIEATGAGDEKRLQLDGRSLMPLLKGQSGVKWRDFYCDTYDMIYLGNNGEKPHMRMIRTDRWKLVLYLDAEGRPLANGSRHELFDLKSDPEELTNLYGKPSVAAVQQQLEKQLCTWMRETSVTKQQEVK